MKHTAIWITIVAILVIGGVVWAQYEKAHRAQLPPPDATLAGPQEPIETKEYNPSIPLSKNKVILQKGMKIEITKEGTGPEIENGQTAEVQYVGRLENGVIFDQGVFPFELGAEIVIKGWDQGVLGMKKGESRTLTIPPELAYGPNPIRENRFDPNSPIKIPANSTLIFDVTLLAIK